MGSLISIFVFQPQKRTFDQDTENDVYIPTKHGVQILVKSIIKDESYLYMIISHGNSEDVRNVYDDWATKYAQNVLNVNLIMYEYTGYEKKDEIQPSEKYCYDDIEAVYKYLTENLKVLPERIIAFGRSVGSGPSCYLAEKYKNIGGLILNCGFMSAYRVIFNFRFTLPGDVFPNIDRMKNITCPVCVIHSIKDEIIPFYHGKELYKAAKNKFDPLYIDGTGHNNIDRISDDVFRHMSKFFKFIDSDYKDEFKQNI